ncbi:hypothetical protein HDU97_006117 [Phlyctochytrium planicorne]|nr:hypothetical protein HDU97_006117 [Phlyctochytrium planicorne]
MSCRETLLLHLPQLIKVCGIKTAPSETRMLAQRLLRQIGSYLKDQSLCLETLNMALVNLMQALDNDGSDDSVLAATLAAGFLSKVVSASKCWLSFSEMVLDQIFAFTSELRDAVADTAMSLEESQKAGTIFDTLRLDSDENSRSFSFQIVPASFENSKKTIRFDNDSIAALKSSAASLYLFKIIRATLPKDDSTLLPKFASRLTLHLKLNEPLIQDFYKTLPRLNLSKRDIKVVDYFQTWPILGDFIILAAEAGWDYVKNVATVLLAFLISYWHSCHVQHNPERECKLSEQVILALVKVNKFIRSLQVDGKDGFEAEIQNLESQIRSFVLHNLDLLGDSCLAILRQNHMINGISLTPGQAQTK